MDALAPLLFLSCVYGAHDQEGKKNVELFLNLLCRCVHILMNRG